MPNLLCKGGPEDLHGRCLYIDSLMLFRGGINAFTQQHTLILLAEEGLSRHNLIWL